jgi:hypothetical protein
VGILREYNKSASGDRVLEVLCEGGETLELEEPLGRHGLRELVVFKHPGVRMMDVDGMKTGGERGVDVGTRTIADHPGGLWRERVPRDDLAINFGVLLGRNLDGGEMHVDAGAIELPLLFAGIALGDENEAMALG